MTTPIKSIAVLHQGMAHIAKLSFFAFALAAEAGVEIGNRRMRFVRALPAMEIHLGVAAFAGFFGPFSPEPTSPAGGLLVAVAFSKLFIEAQASISVPPTGKCSSDNRASLPCPIGSRQEICEQYSYSKAG